jgi:hypothetical protein
VLRGPVVTVAAIALAPLLVTACSDGSGSPPEGAGDVLDPEGETVPYDLGAGFAADLPEGWEVTTFTAGEGQVGPEACSARQATVSSGDDVGDVRVELWLPSAGCAGGEAEQIGNGFHGRYVGVDDAPEPSGVEEHDVPLGPLTTFTQPYFECTNECHDYTDTVGLVALEAPPEPDYPTLMLLSPQGEVDAGTLAGLAEALRTE